MSIIDNLVRKDQPLETGANAVYPYSGTLEKQYRFTSRFGDLVLLHSIENGKILLPRALCPIGKIDSRAKGEKVMFPNGPTPRPNQIKVFKDSVAFLKKGQSGLIVAPTGSGKTIIGYNAAYHMQVKTLVITTKDDIYTQWIDGACGRVSKSNPKGMNFLGLKPHEVGEIRQDKCEVEGTKFCVAMIHSLSKAGKYPNWITKDFGLVIFDECHRLPADSFMAVADKFPALLRVGLTATHLRQDGKDVLLQAHIGPIRAEIETEQLVPKVLRFQTNWQCPRVIRTDPNTGAKKVVRLPHSPGKTMHVEKLLADDDERNELLCNLIHSAYLKGRNIVVFTSFLNHMSILQWGVEKMGIPSKDIGCYQGASTKSEKLHREKIKGRRVLFTTYIMMAEGTDLPWLDTCILAMPRSAVTQAIGRIRREYENKKFPLVIDIFDRDSPVFSGYGGRRLKWYKSINAEFKDM